MRTIKIFIQLFICFQLCSVQAQDIEIFVSDAGNYQNGPWQILKYDENGQNPEVFTNENISWPQDIVFLEDQEILLVSNILTNNITKYNIETGEYLGNFASGINTPTRIKIGPDGLLYVLQWIGGNEKVLRYNLDGTFLGEFTSVPFTQSIGLDWDSDGNLYVSSYSLDAVRKFDTSGNDLGLFISSNLVGPTNIWFDEDGNLIVLDYDHGSIKRFDSNGNYLGICASGLSQVEGIDILDNGNILIGNGNAGAGPNGQVKQYDSNWNSLGNFIPTGSGGLLTPNGIAIRRPSLSVSEFELNETFLTPTMGNEFGISEAIQNRFKKLKVYDSNGKLSETISTENSKWNPSQLSEGIYFIIGNENEKQFSQKIIIKNH